MYMYMYVYIYMYICTYICMYVCTYVCTYVCMYVYIYIIHCQVILGWGCLQQDLEIWGLHIETLGRSRTSSCWKGPRSSAGPPSQILGGSSHLLSGLVHPSYKWINPTYPIYNWGHNPLAKWVVRHQVSMWCSLLAPSHHRELYV